MLSLRVTLGASASVFALVLMASMALASDASTDASVEEDFPILGDGYPVFIDGETLQGAVPEQIKSTCADGGCPEPAEDLPVVVSDDLAELDPIIYQNAAGVAPAVARASSEHSVAGADDIANFCDIAGPGWNWLCAVK